MLHIPWGPCSHSDISDARENRKPNAGLLGAAGAVAGSAGKSRAPCRGPKTSVPAMAGTRPKDQAARRVRVNCWLVELVQFSWLTEISRQLKLIGDWRISEVPLICTEVGAGHDVGAVGKLLSGVGGHRLEGAAGKGRKAGALGVQPCTLDAGRRRSERHARRAAGRAAGDCSRKQAEQSGRQQFCAKSSSVILSSVRQPSFARFGVEGKALGRAGTIKKP